MGSSGPPGPTAGPSGLAGADSGFSVSVSITGSAIRTFAERSTSLLVHRQRVQDDFGGRVVPHTGVHRQMEIVPARPLDPEALENEIGAFAIDGLRQLLGLLLALARLPQTADPLLERSVDENVERIAALPQEERGGAPNDHAVSGLGELGHQLADDGADAFGIHQPQPRGVQAAFEAAAPVQAACDLFAQGLVPKFPAQASGHRGGDGAATAAVFALESDDADAHSAMLSIPLPPRRRRPAG